MSRVLITGGAGMIGSALARRLLADPAYDVRIADERAAPQWMREGCEIRTGDLRIAARADAAVKGCARVIHLAGFHAGEGKLAHARLEHEATLHGAVVRAAIDGDVEHLVYVSSPLVFERAELFPTPEDHLELCAPPRSASGYAQLSAERLCRAAQAEHGLTFTIVRASAAYGAPAIGDLASSAVGERGVSRPLAELIDGAIACDEPVEVAAPSEQTIAPTHVDDVAEAIAATLGSTAALNEDLNIAGPREASVAELARIAWRAAGEPDEQLSLSLRGDGEQEPARSWPSAQKASELLGWQAQVELEQGIAASVRALRERAPLQGRIGSAL